MPNKKTQYIKTFQKLLNNFMRNEKSVGVLLIICTIISILLANSSFHTIYYKLWEMPISLKFGNLNVFSLQGNSLTISEFINDGLMSIFFLMVGLELIHEVYVGKLSKFSQALLPILGALGILSLLGKKVPLSLRIFLTALAVIDDLGAILVIAVFYTKNLSLYFLFLALAIWMLLLLFNRLNVKWLFLYILGGIGIWYCLLHSGVHATLAGILVALTIPFNNGKATQLLSLLKYPVNFMIIPLFALANTALPIQLNFQELFSQPYCLGIFFLLT